MGIFESAFNTGMGLMLEGHNDQRQLEQQEALGKIQLGQQQELNKSNQELALKHWNDTGYEAQRKQMEEAGLNPGLMYGGAGSGGQSFSGGGNVQGGAAPQGGNEILQAQQLGLQREMQESQIENVKADTKKKEVEADVTGGVGKANTEADTKNKEAELAWKNMQNEIQKETMWEAQETILAKYRQEIAKADQEANNATISNTIFKDKIKSIQQQAIGAELENTLSRAKINLTYTQAKAISEEIQQGWDQLDINEKNYEENAKRVVNETIEREFRTGTGAQIERGTRIFKTAAEGIMEFIPTKIKTTNTREGQRDEEGGYWESSKSTTTKSH